MMYIDISNFIIIIKLTIMIFIYKCFGVKTASVYNVAEVNFYSAHMGNSSKTCQQRAVAEGRIFSIRRSD